MARPIWSGQLSFGLVNVPVKAFSGVHDHTVHFHQLVKKTGARIRYDKVSASTGRHVDDDDIERGFELEKGKYVVVDPDEFDALRPRSTRSIDISDFVDLAAVDPIYYVTTYWLAPDGEGAERAYRLLLAAMDEAQRAGIGTTVMRNKQYLAAIRPLDGVLAMSTMRFADEVVAKEDIDGLPVSRPKPDAKELRLAKQIIDSLASNWDPKRYHDTYTEELRHLIERKAKGEELTVGPEEELPSAEVVDLMAALRASLERGRPASSGRGKKATGAVNKTARTAKKTGPAAKKTRPAAKKAASGRRSA